jgi:nickel transport protein
MHILRSVIVFLILACSLSPAQAHKVNMFAHVEGNQITVEGYFTDGRPAAKAQIQVLSPSGERLLTGTADDEGVFSFDIPQVSDLRITLYAGMGHRAEYTVPEAELAGAASLPAGANGAIGANADAGGVGSAEVEAMVRKAVGEALLPVSRGLSELKEQRTFSDIVGGIGFIFGLIGVFFYLKARRMVKGGAAASGGVSG